MPSSSADLTLYPPPPTPNSGQQKRVPTKGPNTLLFLLRWKIAQTSSTCNKLGAGRGESLPVSHIYLYKICYYWLGSIWRAEETWQWILTISKKHKPQWLGEKNKKRKKTEREKKRERQRSFKCNVCTSHYHLSGFIYVKEEGEEGEGGIGRQSAPCNLSYW